MKLWYIKDMSHYSIWVQTVIHIILMKSGTTDSLARAG